MYKSIGIVVAMKEELNGMLSVFGEQVASDNICGLDIYEYARDDKKVFLIQSGIGNIASALATQLLIERHKVEVIINFGLAGGVSSDFKTKDVVLVDSISPYDFWFNMQDRARQGVLLGQTDNHINIDYSEIAAVKKLCLPTCRTACADKFVNDSVFKEELKKTFAADVCEMESYGIYSACEMYNIPCIFLKAISDSADESAVESFSEIVKGIVDFYKIAIEKLLSDL